MQPTFAAFDFKVCQVTRMDCHQVQWKKILTHADSLQAWTPKKREELPSSWLSQFDLLGFDEKRGTMHLMFHFNEIND